MLRLSTAFVSLAWVVLICSSATAQGTTTGRGLPSERMLDSYGLKLAWWGQAVLNPGVDRVRYVTLDEEVVVVQSVLGAVTVFDHNTGHRLWTSQYGRPGMPSYPVAINNDLIVVPVGTHCFGVNKFSGRLVWRLHLEGDPSTSPSLDDARMYVGAVDGTVYAYNLKNVLRYYEEGQDEKWSFLGVDWRYKAGKEINAPPVTNGMSIAFSSKDGLLYSLASLDHNLRFQVETDDPISARLAMSDNLLYIVTESYKAYCVSADRGGIIWEFVTGSPMHIGPNVIGDQLFLSTDSGNLFNINKFSGVQNWMRENVGQFAAATNSFAYLSDQTGDVVMLSRADGSELGTLPLRYYSIRPQNDRTDRLFAVSEGGRVLCIHERGRDYPTYHKFPDRRPILPEITPENEAAAATIEGAAEKNDAEPKAEEAK